MKKKLFLTVVMTFVFALALAFAVSAEGVHSNLSSELLNKKVTVMVTEDDLDGTEVNLFDSEGNALIWFVHGDELKSIRADDTDAGTDGNYVEYRSANGGALILGNVIIHLGTETVAIKDIVVFNIMDDDIDTYYNPKTQQTVENDTTPFIHICETFNRDNKNPNSTMRIEYAYLRLDTYNIAGKAFAHCTKLKYVNLESLTSLVKIGEMSGFKYGACFWGCTSLFDGQTLDLSKTQLKSLTFDANAHSGNFQGVPLVGIKLPTTFNQIGKYEFNNCTNLTTIYFGKDATAIDENTFSGCTALKAIYYVGTAEELSTSIVKSHFADATSISYAEYVNLSDSDKSEKQYLIYNSACAYNGAHGTIAEINACVDKCTDCELTFVEHSADAQLSVDIKYTDYTAEGEKVTACTNEGCTYSVTEKAPALFTNQGFSTQENGGDSIVICYLVDKAAITAYEATGKTVEYGVFAVLNDNLTDASVEPLSASGVIKADLTDYGFDAFNLKITGFETEAQKDAKIVLGAYVTVSDKTYYMQDSDYSEKCTNDNYYYTSYNMRFPATTEAN